MFILAIILLWWFDAPWWVWIISLLFCAFAASGVESGDMSRPTHFDQFDSWG